MLDETIELWRPHPACSSCAFPNCARDGKTAAGHQRWHCPVCDTAFSTLIGTALEFGRKKLPTWERFITCMCYNAPIDLVAKVCGINDRTAYEWRHRVFATVDGYQDRLRLGSLVLFDELYLTDSDIVRSTDFVQKRGLSKNVICFVAVVDAFKNAVVVICVHGKPSSKRIMDAALSHMAPDSAIAHDMERSHPPLVRAAKCTDEAYKAGVTGPTYLKAMKLMNNLCF